MHSGPESLRHEFNAQVTKKDLWETYLPAFEALVTEAAVEGVMGAYNRTNGEPCCGSKTLLQDILREKWGFAGYVTSDCWAIRDFHEHHMVTHSMQESVALALSNGCDINCGNAYLHMLSAYHEGLVTEEQIERACVHAMTTRMRLGLFDDACEFNAIGYERNAAPEHLETALEAARKSMVLLKNDGALPLDPKKLETIAVVGPNADNRVALMGNYHGTADRYVTVLEGLQDALEPEGVRVVYSVGCELHSDRSEGLAAENDRIMEAVAGRRDERSGHRLLGAGREHRGRGGGSGGRHRLRRQTGPGPAPAAANPAGKAAGDGQARGSGAHDRQRHGHQSGAGALQSDPRSLVPPGARGGKAVAEALLGGVSPSGKLPVTFYRVYGGPPGVHRLLDEEPHVPLL